MPPQSQATVQAAAAARVAAGASGEVAARVPAPRPAPAAGGAGAGAGAGVGVGALAAVVDEYGTIVFPRVSPGLHNGGNNCFINTALQCAFASPTIVAYLQTLLTTANLAVSGDVVATLKPIFDAYFSGRYNASGNPIPTDIMSPFHTALRQLFTHGDDANIKSGRDQGDAGEAFTKLFTTLERVQSCNDRPVTYKTKQKTCTNQACSSGGNAYIVTTGSSDLNCTILNNAIELSVPKLSATQATISSMISAYEAGEETDALVSCDRCSNQATARQTYYTKILPTSRYLAFSLNRVDNLTGLKRTTRVSPDNEIIISGQDDDMPAARYRLIAIGDHTGSARGGHWFTRKFNYITNAWEGISDTSTIASSKPSAPSALIALAIYERIGDVPGAVAPAAAAAHGPIGAGGPAVEEEDVLIDPAPVAVRVPGSAAHTVAPRGPSGAGSAHAAAGGAGSGPVAADELAVERAGLAQMAAEAAETPESIATALASKLHSVTSTLTIYSDAKNTTYENEPNLEAANLTDLARYITTLQDYTRNWLDFTGLVAQAKELKVDTSGYDATVTEIDKQLVFVAKNLTAILMRYQGKHAEAETSQGMSESLLAASIKKTKDADASFKLWKIKHEMRAEIAALNEDGLRRAMHNQIDLLSDTKRSFLEIAKIEERKSKRITLVSFINQFILAGDRFFMLFNRMQTIPALANNATLIEWRNYITSTMIPELRTRLDNLASMEDLPTGK